MQYVIDASALLVYLNGEKGSSFVEELIDSSMISAVNLSEVIGKLKDKKVPEKDVDLILKLLPCEVVDFSKEQALIAGMIKSKTTSLGLSLGDRACLALAIQKKVSVLTADKAWKKVNLGIKVVLVR